MTDDDINPFWVANYISGKFDRKFSTVKKTGDNQFMCSTPMGDELTVYFVSAGDYYRPEFVFHNAVTIQDKIPFVVPIRKLITLPMR